jgi:predicted TIM-barrel fold metal-dependent hydrolase
MNRLGNIVVALLTVAIVGLVAWLGLSKFGVVPPPPVASHTPTSEGSKKHKLAYLNADDPTVKVDALGPRKWKIVDIHEHAKGEAEAKQLLKHMDSFGIQRTVLMASTTYTLTLNPIYGFEGFKENSEALIEIKKKWPDRFSAFVTFDPCSATDDNLALVKDWVARGADGVKLYLGHGATTPRFAFHCMPLDDPRMEPFFAWAEEVQLPILLHVNLEKYWDEMLHVLETHPYLRVTLPHFGLHKNTEQRLRRLGFLLDRYPYVYTDISFGYYTFQIDGFEVLAKFRSRSREFLARYAHKTMYASDMVLEPSKDDAYIADTLRSYLQFLEAERWRFFLVPKKTMHGMGLDEKVLKTIYEDAPRAFLLLDKDGNMPDRTKDPKVEVPRPPLAPLTPEMIPPLRKDAPAASSQGAPGASPSEPKPGEAGCEHEDAATDD